jgi:hypothetical protein
MKLLAAKSAPANNAKYPDGRVSKKLSQGWDDRGEAKLFKKLLLPSAMHRSNFITVTTDQTEWHFW